MTCLPDIETSIEIITGDNGILSFSNDEKIIIDHSTVGISTSKEM